MPACRVDHLTSPEQSNISGPSPPQTYGMPTRLLAAARKARICARSSAARRPPHQPAPARPGGMGWPTDQAGGGATSGTTAADDGAASLMELTREAKLSFGAATMIALPAGKPTRCAAVADTMASTPTDTELGRTRNRQQRRRRPFDVQLSCATWSCPARLPDRRCRLRQYRATAGPTWRLAQPRPQTGAAH
jgi:hypothetical protein